MDSEETSPAPQFKIINSSVLSLLCGSTLTSLYDYCKAQNFDYMDLCRQCDVSAFNVLFRFVIVFLPRSKCLLNSWRQSPYAVISETKNMKSVTASISSICYEVMGSDVLILKGCCWISKRRWNSWPLEEKNSIQGQRWGLIAQSFCVIKFY